MRQTRQLHLLLLVPLMVLFVFSCLPMIGLVIAFQDYNIFKYFFASKWSGFAVFREIFRMPSFWVALRNIFIPRVVDPVMFGVIAPLEGMKTLRKEAGRILGRQRQLSP